MKAKPAVRVTYAYGDLNVMNYYINKSCLDDFQLRVQFADVRGPGDATKRSEACVAKPVSTQIDADSALLLVFRPFVPQEVRARDSVAAIGWRSVSRHEAAGEHLVVELFNR